MRTSSQNDKLGLFVGILIACVMMLSFQNCAKTSIEQEDDEVVTIDSACINADCTLTEKGSILRSTEEAASVRPSIEDLRIQRKDRISRIKQPKKIVRSRSRTSETAAAGSASLASTSTQLYNFVASDKLSCEKAIENRLGISKSCTVGGGCGISCGMPNASCASANPSLFGACIDPLKVVAPVVSEPSPVPTQLYNFVAGDKVTCEQSIAKRLGLNSTCTVGGGCGISCGMPSASCASANPSLFGACILF